MTYQIKHYGLNIRLVVMVYTVCTVCYLYLIDVEDFDVALNDYENKNINSSME